MSSNKQPQSIKRANTPKLLFVVSVAIVGVLVTSLLLAASPNHLAFQAENMTVVSPATVVADTSASGNSFVQFAEAPSATYPYECEPYEPLQPRGSGVVREVSNTSQMNAAFAAAQPGDVINLKTGVYQILQYRQSLGYANGTASAPIVIQAGAGQSPVIDGGGENVNGDRAVFIARRDNIWVRGLEVRNDVFGISVMGVDGGGVQYNKVHDHDDVGITAQGYYSDHLDGSSFIDISCNEIHNIHGTFHVGEGIYLGHGSGELAKTTHDITIRNNHIYDVTSEGVEIKSPVYNVTVEGNHIHDIVCVDGYGICAGVAVAPFNGSERDGNYLVEGNIIHDLTSYNGSRHVQAILIGDGTTTVRNNLIYRIEDSGIGFQPNDSGGHGFGNWRDVFIYNNTLYDCGGVGCRLTHSLANITSKNNAMSANATGNDRTTTSADFVGPLTGNAVGSSGLGSGFIVKPSSGARDSASAISDFNKDLRGFARPTGAGWDYGAFEQ